MKKRHLKGKPCVYCQGGASTRNGDHVFARSLFLTSRRDGIPKVPACERCNHQKSVLEQYLLTVLPFGAHHPDALENLRNQVPTRLDKNVKLRKMLFQDTKFEYIQNEGGIWEKRMTIGFDINKLLNLCNFITCALIKIHFELSLENKSIIYSTIQLENIDSFLNGPSHQIVHRVLGNHTIEYNGIQAISDSNITVWQYKFYGEIEIQGRKSRSIFSFTGPKNIFQ